jgi:PAS domain S-box-containing protein
MCRGTGSGVAEGIQSCNRAEDAPRQSEEHYRLLVEGQAELLCQFTPEGTILFVNGAYALACGTTREALIGRNFWDFIPSESHDSIRKMLEQLTPERPEVQIENRFQTVSGSRWILWTNRALRFSREGRLQEAQSTGIDITDRKEAEEALRESEARFRAMADAAPVLIWVSGTDGLFTWFNKPWLDFTGRTMEQEVGQGWVANVHAEDLKSCLNAYGAAFDLRKAFSMEYRLRRHDGEYRWLLDQGHHATSRTENSRATSGRASISLSVSMLRGHCGTWPKSSRVRTTRLSAKI